MQFVHESNVINTSRLNKMDRYKKVNISHKLFCKGLEHMTEFSHVLGTCITFFKTNFIDHILNERDSNKTI